MSEVYTTKQVAQIIGCTSGNVARMIRAKELEASKTKQGYEISPRSLHAWIYVHITFYAQEYIDNRLHDTPMPKRNYVVEHGGCHGC